MDNMNTPYQYIVTFFVLNKMLYHVGMLWIIDTHDKLKYDMDKHNSYWMTGDHWYNISVCKKYM